MTEQKSPPSEMIRVPTALIPVVRQLSKLHREGHTIALLQGLEELISKFDSNIDIDVTPSSKSVLQMDVINTTGNCKSCNSCLNFLITNYKAYKRSNSPYISIYIYGNF